MVNEEQVGFHKGAVSTLIKERQELARMLGIVDSLLQAHVEALKKLGVDITQQAPAEEKKTVKTKR